MSEQSDRTFSSDFKRFFLRGLVVLLPSVLTLWIVVMAYQFVDKNIAEPINRGVRLAMNNAARYWEPLRNRFDPTDAQLNTAVADSATARRVINRDHVRRELRRDLDMDPTDEQVNAAIAQHAEVVRAVNREAIRTELRQQNIRIWWNERWYMSFIGLIVAVIAVYTAGRLLGGYFGRRIYARLERLLTTIPVFKQLYPSVKQVVDFLFSEEQALKFNRVVVTEYPRRGIWSVGFLTGPTLRSVAEHAGDAVTIFIPSSPTPFTGYTITVPRSEVIEIPLSVDEAIRFAVSGGVLIPDHQKLEPGMIVQGKPLAAPDKETVKLIAARQDEIEDDPASEPAEDHSPATRSPARSGKPKRSGRGAGGKSTT